MGYAAQGEGLDRTIAHAAPTKLELLEAIGKLHDSRVESLSMEGIGGLRLIIGCDFWLHIGFLEFWATYL